MARISTTQIDVANAVVSRLIARIAAFNSSNCYLASEPDPQVEKSQNLFAQVSIGDGRYDDPAHTGGGVNQIFELSTIWVSIFSRLKLDQVQHSKQLLTDSARGLLALKKEVLAALAGHDLQDASGNKILINFIAPVSAARPLTEWEGFSAISLAFSADFEWDLMTTTTTP